MGNDGIQMTGTWINSRTGDKIQVRDNIIDGESMIILTDKGQIPIDIFCRDYIQVSDEVYEMPVNESNSYNEIGIDNENLKADTVKSSTVIDLNTPIGYANELKSYNTTPSTNPTLSTNTILNMENDVTHEMLEKFFDKLHTSPQIRIEIYWENIPKEQISTLVNFLDIDKKSIADYIRNRFITDDEVNNEITKFIDSVIA